MDVREKLRVHRAVSAAIVAVGLALMIGMIRSNGEPGAIPLLLVVLGTVWHLVTRARARSQRKRPH